MSRWLWLIVMYAGLLAPAFGQQDERLQSLFGGAGAATAQPSQIPAITNPNRVLQMATEPGLPTRNTGLPPPPAPKPAPQERHEFQDFVVQSLGKDLPLFGFDLFQNVPSTFAPLDRVPVTPDYLIGPGDELVINAWGQVDIDYRATVDRNGAISIPRVGNINVTGVRFQDVEAHIKRSIGRVFTNFDLKVTMGQLRAIQIFVVGQAVRPGVYTVSSLSTLVNALFAAGGPSVKGSMRTIQLKRGDKLITEFDMYDLLLKGDKSKDVRLLPGDVIYIPPTGQLVAISGSVTLPAIYEIRGRSKLSDVIALAGGLTVTASGQKVSVERIFDRKTRRVEDFNLDKEGLEKLVQDGDFVKVNPLSPRFDNAITVRGNVAVAARHPWRSGMRVKDVVPDREALIVPDYWVKRNLSVRTDIAGQEREEIRQREAAARSQGASQEREDPRQRERAQGAGQERLRAEVRRVLPEVNWDYAVIERLNLTDLTTALIPFNLGKAILEDDPAHNVQLQPGDVITIFSKDDIQVQFSKQPHFVKLEGEVAVSGVYQVKPGETLRQLVTRVGGLSPNAYLFGAEFERESTRAFQQKRLDEVLDRLEQEVQRNQGLKANLSKEEAEQAKSAADGQLALVNRLRKIKATGRIVLEIPADQAQLGNLPDLRLEDGDRFFIPAMPSTVSVVGSVYTASAFIYRPSKRLIDYLEQAGGPTKDGDSGSIYLIRADGSVISKRQAGYLFSRLESERIMPGDTVVVPENLDRFRFTKEVRDWSQIFYQFALGVAGLKVLRDF
jgi:polysaccharide biosynthesis/export protein